MKQVISPSAPTEDAFKKIQGFFPVDIVDHTPMAIWVCPIAMITTCNAFIYIITPCISITLTSSLVAGSTASASAGPKLFCMCTCTHANCRRLDLMRDNISWL